MTTRTVLNVNPTDVTDYSTGSLDVSDLTELAIDILVTAASDGTPIVYDPGDGSSRESVSYSFSYARIAAWGGLGFGGVLNSYAESWSYPDYTGTLVYPVGPLQFSLGVAAGSTPFGDHIQIDLFNPQGITMTFNLSIIGK